MVRIDSVLQIQEAVKSVRDLKKGYQTNLYIAWEKLNNWIKHDLLFFLDLNSTVLFFKKNASFFNVFYCSITLENLSVALNKLKSFYPDEVFVFDIIGEKYKITDTIKVFNASGFNLYTSLIRMSRLIGDCQEQTTMNGLKYGESTDISEIFKLLHEYFDEYAEQLPLIYDLRNWIADNHILLYVEKETIIGFVIFDIMGKTSYLRYWFVHPEHRNKKIGSSLLNWFFYESKYTKRQYFWVIESNENAIIRYKHYGFEQETLVDQVFINLGIRYETKSN